MKLARPIAVLSALALAAACTGEAGPSAATSDGGAAASAAGTPAGGPLTPDPGGRVIVVQMITDEHGSYYEPADFEARKGDVVRFTLAGGVHNVSFPADSNPAGADLPAPGPMLQLPGQSTDVKVDWAPGRYFHQCDPHALLGMVGRITVR